jgi:formate dehydrogenase subunit delta
MNVEHLVRMANDIAAFFQAESSPAQAPQDVASHLKRFWDPRMRREILAHLDGGGAGLSGLARRAVELLAAGTKAEQGRTVTR